MLEGAAYEEAPSLEKRSQCDLHRCIFGNPFRRPPALDRSLLTPDILALAQAAYDERKPPAGTLEAGRFADALEAVSSLFRRFPAPSLVQFREVAPHRTGRSRRVEMFMVQPRFRAGAEGGERGPS